MVICPHAGQVSILPSSPRVFVGGQPVATMADTYLIAGCPFTVPPGPPQPCVRVQWIVPAARIRVQGQFAILQSSTGLCIGVTQAPQGPPTIVMTQVRARGM